MTVHYCPVCYRVVEETVKRNIPGHFDKSGKICPGVGNPFYITIERDWA